MNLINHTVFITGGSSGLGLALAKNFAALGNKVIICGRNAQKLQAVLDQNERFVGIVADITAPKAIYYILNILAKNNWYPSIIVNNAGCGASIDILSGNADHFIVHASNQIQTNIQAPMNLVVAFLPILKMHPNAAIINITSGLAISPKKSSPIYCATKAALRAFTKSLRYQIEDAKLNIRVMEVLPPVVDTPMTASNSSHSKITSEEVAQDVINGLLQNKKEVYVGKVWLLKMVHSISPSLADMIMRNW
jgi:short-subunit dehydrogenase